MITVFCDGPEHFTVPHQPGLYAVRTQYGPGWIAVYPDDTADFLWEHPDTSIPSERSVGGGVPIMEHYVSFLS
ncbi:hypothetical protein [Sulfobacillus thermosulfidooxidans]|uniref:hypothetical protein n=1 Tax=Sulfobacillus thermosulfidooxidans TaxID=28034 RepID=UPI0006B55001|nr:hypothetical protein [Sulfobacillus thermosulfidooxidans]